MSGLLAIVADEPYLPIEPALVDGMLAAERQRGPDRVSTWTDGRVTMAECHLATTPEAIAERQPHANESETVRVIFDGRIDNGDDLRAAGLPVRDATDVELVLRAYERWGPSCAARLLGDFAFVVWDVSARALLAARDVFGFRPLYIHHQPGLLLLASEITPLLRHPAVRREPNEGFVAECLAGQVADRGATVWRAIERLPPAHTLTFRDGIASVRRHWSPDPRATIRYRHDEEYADHLADLLRAATRARARSAAPLGVMLSGGLDSSSIVGALNEPGGPAPLDYRTYSLSAPGEPWDETPYVDAVCARWPAEARRIKPFVPDPAYFGVRAASYADLPPYPNAVMARDLFTTAANDGVRTLLTGLMSDEWFAGSFTWYADLLRRGRVWQAWRHYRDQPDDPDAFRPLSMFRAALWPLVPERAQVGIKRLLGRDGVPPWIEPRFAAGAGLADRIRPRRGPLAFDSLTKSDTFNRATCGWVLQAIEAEQRGLAEFGLESRHPFGDRRIAEFALAIPDDQRWRGRLTKFVLRNASRRWVPRPILERTASGVASNVVADALRAELAQPCWADPLVGRLGWIRRDEFRAACDRVLAGFGAGDLSCESLLFPLWSVCAVDIWARTALKENRHG